MKFVKNAWYVAAWADEVGSDNLFYRTILGDSILLFRQEDGVAVALRNRCPHRFVPLHLGKKIGNTVQCAYHGLVFNAQGKCSATPCGESIPRGAEVRSYPLVEKQKLLYIWMGDPVKADESKIPDFWYIEDDSWASVKGYIRGESNYQLMVDNILDLTHTNYLHADTLGSEALATVKTDIEDKPEHLRLKRWMPNQFQAPLSAASRGFAHRLADSWLDTTWYPPSNMVIEMGMTEPGGRREDGKVAFSLHLVTPETETSNHYFWSMSRDYCVEDSEMTRVIGHGFEKAFTVEDKPVLEHQQRAMGETSFWDMKPIFLAGDSGALRARRRIDAMLAEEQA